MLELENAYKLKKDMARKSGIDTTAIDEQYAKQKSAIVQAQVNSQLEAFSGLAGALGSLAGATDFIRGVSPGYGNAPQDLEFTNTYGGTTLYIMRGSGNISSSKDDKADDNLSS